MYILVDSLREPTSKGEMSGKNQFLMETSYKCVVSDVYVRTIRKRVYVYAVSEAKKKKKRKLTEGFTFKHHENQIHISVCSRSIH